MGEWMHYTIKFANKEESVADALVAKGYATKKQGTDRNGNPMLDLVLDLKKMSPTTFANGYQGNDGLEYITIGIEGNAVYYINKWAPDDRLASAISKCFPDDVMDSKRVYTGGISMDVSWYEKNGQDTLKDGTPVVGAIVNLNPKLLKERRNKFQVSIPIGEGDNKWGTIVVPKDHVKYNTSRADGEENKYNIMVFFANKEIDVAFKNGVVSMNTEDVLKKYYESKHDYREEMNKAIEIHGLAESNFIRQGTEEDGYYIVKIPCPTDVSSNGMMSITLSDWNVDKETGDICIGLKGKSKNARIQTSDGVMVTKEFNIGYIKECYEQAVATRSTTQVEESVVLEAVEEDDEIDR